MDQTDTLASEQPSSATIVTLARVGIVVTAVSAFVVVLDLFGLGVLGLVLGAIGAALAFPYGWGQRWYFAVGGGAALAVIAALVSGPHQTAGGWLAVIAAVLILIGAPLGYPGGPED